MLKHLLSHFRQAGWVFKALLLICTGLAGQHAFAATCTSVQDGNWNGGTNVWSGCNLSSNAPPAGATVVISNSRTVTVNVSSAAMGTVTINSGATLRVASGAALSLTGNFANNGTFTGSSTYSGTVSFSGTAQTISGSSSITFYKLTVGANALTLSRNVTVSNSVTGTPTLQPTCPTDYTLTTPSSTLHSCVVTCSSYKGSAFLNEVRIGASRSSSTLNQIEIFNSANVASTVWRTWKLAVNYRSGSNATPTVYGPYPLSTGFTNNGQFIYNSTTGIYLRNKTGRNVDIALLDSAGNFIDYLALGSSPGVPMQTVPSCMGTPTITAPSASNDSSGDLARLPDGSGSWPATVTSTTSHTIGWSNACTQTGLDLAVTNSVDAVNPTINTTLVTYSVTVTNKSCSLPINNISLTYVNSLPLNPNVISTANFNFSPSTFQVSTGSVTAPSTTPPVWTVGTLAAGATATMTISGTPKVLGQLKATAIATAPGNATSLINPGDDSAVATILVYDYNYLGFTQTSATVTEGVDASYTVSIATNVAPTKPVNITYTVTGTGSGSSDISLPATRTVTIDPTTDPSNQVDITFSIVDDALFEPTKTITFTITGISSTDASVQLLPAASTLNITLLDNDLAQVVAEYHLDSGPWTGAAAEVDDSSGNGLDGTAAPAGSLPLPLNATPARTGSSVGTCGYGRFGGSNTTGPRIGVGAVNLGTDNAAGLSVSAWVRWAITPSTGNAWATIAANGKDTTAQFTLQHSQTNSNFEFAVRTSAGRQYVQSNTAPVMGTWYHVVGVYDGAALHIYVNGALDDKNTVLQTGTVVAHSTSDGFNIGADSGNSTFRDFNGDIDEVKVFNGGVNASQALTLYAETHTCPAPPIDHIRIDHDGQGLSCAAESVSINVCSGVDSGSPASCTLYTGGVTGNLDIKDASGSTTLGTAGFIIPTGSGSVSVTLPAVSAQTVTFQVSALSATPSGASAWTCWNSSLGNSGCAMPVSACPSGGFNCLESTITPYSNASARLYTKLAGTSFNVDVVALSAAGAQEANYVVSGGASRSVTVELVDGSGATACASRSAISPAVSQALSFSSADANPGRKTASMTVSKAYTDLRCRVTDANQSPSVVSCSSDDFSVRPGAVTLSATMATPPSASSLPAIKTGAAFTLRAATSTSATDGYTGTLTRDTSKLTAQTTSQDSSAASGGAVGTLSPATLQAKATPSNNASYDEVGYLYLAPGAYSDSGFTGVDQAGGDCVAGSSSVVASSGKYGCNIGNPATVSFGRFIPDHFDVTVGANGAMAAGCAAGSFSYAGQAMHYLGTSMPALTIKPMSAASGGHVTQNYQGVFQKLAAVSITTPTADTTQLGQDGVTKTTLTAALGAGTFTNSSGTLTYTLASSDSFTYPRDANALVGAYTNAIALVVSGVTDGEVSALGSLPTLSPTGVSMRYGRLRLQNAYGSELIDLPIPLEAQYWAGSYYVTNADDACTVIPMSSIAMSNYLKTLVACKTQITPTGSQTLVAGKLPGTGLVLSKPGSAYTGSVDLTLNLATATGSTCVSASPSAATAANLPWFGTDPTARATFGIYGKAKAPIIYRRENY